MIKYFYLIWEESLGPLIMNQKIKINDKKFAQMIQNINIMSLKKDMKKEKEKFKFSKNIKKKKKMIFKGKNRLLLKI